MAGVVTDHMCSPMTVADQTNAKMATSLAKKKDKRVYFHFSFCNTCPYLLDCKLSLAGPSCLGY